MIAFPNAKINFGLKVVKRRPDGFHDIETMFYPVGIYDMLEVIVASDDQFMFSSSGLAIPGDPEDNLCIRAFNLISREIKIPPVKIHLHKIIPMGAGIGGGSADGAFMIKLLNELFSLGFSDEKMIEYAALLGSDCSFFIRNKAAFGEGKGDRFSPVNVDLSKYKIVIVFPDVHVNTREAYEWLDSHQREIDMTGEQNSLKLNAGLPPELWKDKVSNDFEMPVFSKHPEIRRIKEILYSKGAVYASMSGSGAAVYGLFKDMPADFSGFGNALTWIG